MIHPFIRFIKSREDYVFSPLGYDFCGARNEQKTYYLFVLRGENEISLQHIHCYGSQDKEYFQLVAFRDYLNNHDDVAKQYEQLKIKLAQKKYKVEYDCLSSMFDIYHKSENYEKIDELKIMLLELLSKSNKYEYHTLVYKYIKMYDMQNKKDELQDMVNFMINLNKKIV